ncbi:MAG TPA: hypothetical protein PKE31_11255 [Pseudomonadota bacterium]|nr:hypothetical protein [Pseudomonadota bacterium]
MSHRKPGFLVSVSTLGMGWGLGLGLGLTLAMFGTSCGSIQSDDGKPVSSLLVSVKGDFSGGTIVSQPSGIECGSTCSATFAVGQSVTLTATLDDSHTFVGWEGDCTGTGLTCTLPMDKGKAVTAVYKSNVELATVQVQLAGSGAGSVSSQPAGIACPSLFCSGGFAKGQTVTLTATPDGTSYFTGWGGACSGTTTTCNLSVTSDAQVTANFGVPSSCEQLRAATPALTDGNYTLFVTGDKTKPWTAYCVMSVTPALTYITLTNTGGNFNFSQYTATGAPGTNVRTNYSRLLFDTTTLKVDTNDKRFGISNGGSLQHGATTVQSMPFAVAMGCNGTANGLANMDFTGTKFAVAANTLAVGGSGSSGTTTPAPDGQAKVINMTGGGGCGWNAPATSFDPFNSQGLPLQLSYAP